jgi:membrane protein
MPPDIKQVSNFLQRDIWRIPSRKLTRRHSFFIRYLRVIVLAVREFQDNQRQLDASALTFYTLLSIVPVMAMAFGIAKGFGYDQLLEKELLSKFPGQEQTITQIIHFANNLLKDTQGGLIAGASVIMLFWTVIKVLDGIETSFNDIWGVKKSRSLSRKVSDYLSIMLVCPFAVIVTSALSVFLYTKIELILNHMSFLGSLIVPFFWVLYSLPYVMMGILFTFIYIFIPNTKVNFSSGLIAGLLAGTLYQVVQSIYIQFQIGVANANVIYGSFAALPLFLIWLQVSWKIVLFGTEVSFAHQNANTYEFEQDCLNVNHAFQRLLSLHIASTIVKRFANGEPLWSANQIADSLDIPIRLVQAILFNLTAVGVLSPSSSDSQDKQPLYQPAQDISRLTIAFVSELLDKKGTGDIPVAQNAQLKRLQELLANVEEIIRGSSCNKLLKDI